MFSHVKLWWLPLSLASGLRCPASRCIGKVLPSPTLPCGATTPDLVVTVPSWRKRECSQWGVRSSSDGHLQEGGDIRLYPSQQIELTWAERKEKEGRPFLAEKNHRSVNVNGKMPKLYWKAVDELVGRVWFSAHVCANHVLSSPKMLQIRRWLRFCSSDSDGEVRCWSERRKGTMLWCFQRLKYVQTPFFL